MSYVTVVNYMCISGSVKCSRGLLLIRVYTSGSATVKMTAPVQMFFLITEFPHGEVGIMLLSLYIFIQVKFYDMFKMPGSKYALSK